MFASNHHSMVGSDEDPADGGKVATAVFGAVVVYAVGLSRSAMGHQDIGTRRTWTSRKKSRANDDIQVFLLFCGCQAFMHKRQSRQGEIALR